MAKISKSQVRVFVEVDDALYDMTGEVRNISINTPISGMTELSMDIVGSGMWKTIDVMRKTMHEAVHAEEWQCSYCRRANKRADTVCEGCGGIRSFIYG